MPDANAITVINPNGGELDTIERMAKLLIQSGFTTSARSPEQAATLIMMGRELGIPAMQALSTIHVIEGKPTASVHLLGAMLARGGVTWEVVRHDDIACEILFHRPTWPAAIKSLFTVEDAKRAGLSNKGNWVKYPRAMLFARAFGEGARMIGPDLLCGVNYTPEEINPNIAVDASGDIVAASKTEIDIPTPPQYEDSGEYRVELSEAEQRAEMIPPAAPIRNLGSSMRAAFARAKSIGIEAETFAELCRTTTGKESRKDCTVDDWLQVHKALDYEEDRVRRIDQRDESDR